jgi:uncharacterized protein
MKVLAISDNVLPQLEDPRLVVQNCGDVEAVISCGDLPAPYLELIGSALNVPVMFVRGNHDTNYTEDRPGGDNLDGRIIHYKGLTFAGLEGSPRYNQDPVQYTESEMLFKMLRLAPGMLLRRLRHGYGVDVMVTHSPPRDIHDLPDRTHRGFQSLRLLIRLFRPRYFLHGHVDTWDRRRPTTTIFAGTEIININPSKILTLERRSADGPR